MAVNFSPLKESIHLLLQQEPLPLQSLCEFLKLNVPHYNWVGIYYMEDDTQTLQLGPYAGAATDHTCIAYGRGICGQVAVSGQTYLVPDVWAETNYLACSLETKAEIVVPIYKQGKLIAQLDIDSHYANPFTEEDRQFLEEICLELGDKI